MPRDLDIVIALDMDEILRPNWRSIIEENWTTDCTRLRYRYVWSWTNDNKPDVMYYDVKVTSRSGWRWRYACHEVMFPTQADVMVTYDDILVEHHPDLTKSRGQYLPLLELAVREDAQDSRSKFLLAREYFAQNQFELALKHYQEYLNLPAANWPIEKAAAMRHIAKSLEVLDRKPEAQSWYLRACTEDPSSREILVDTGRFMAGIQRFHAAIDCAERALAIGDGMSPQQDERYARQEGPYDVMAVAYFSLGQLDQAILMGEQALRLNPTEQRLKDNLDMMRQKQQL
jgi:tetratricopeptide (TPR) repeat protein